MPGGPPVKTGMSGGLKALLIVIGIFTGLGVLAVGGFLVVGALVVNEANEIANTAASELEEDLDDLEDAADDSNSGDDGDDPFGSSDDEEEDDGGFGSSSDDEADLASWCSTVDEFDAFARASTEGFGVEEMTDKILTIDEMIDEVRDTAPSEMASDTEEVLLPFEETVAIFESVDFDPRQVTAEDQAALNEAFEDALPAVIAVRQACLDEGISVFESD